jgi:ribosomal protein L7/L12
MEVSIRSFLAWLDDEFQARQYNPNPPYPYNPQTETIELPEEIEKELIALLREGPKAEAVKRIAKLTGAGLRISKDYVDKMLSRL